MEAPFVLDLEANPHPDLRSLAGQAFQDKDCDPRYWEGIRDAMIAATGSPDTEVVEWVRRGLSA